MYLVYTHQLVKKNFNLKKFNPEELKKKKERKKERRKKRKLNCNIRKQYR